MHARIREIVLANGQLPAGSESLGDDADLYQAGLTSHASVNLMLALEDEFEVEFPEAMLLRRTFESVNSIASALDRIRSTSNVSRT